MVEAIAFSSIAGFPEAEARLVMLKGYGARIELFKYYTPTGKECGPRRQCDFGMTHFELSVKNIHQIYEHLSEAGVQFNCPPRSRRPGVWATYMKAPDGVTIELVEYE